ncbi:MAG TPA: ATP-binding protein, partial [Candidatus Ozemobacteraceae bacterium]|nr:ATP-binding protein [Candidatus Ozemobacteraceae bacterium]
QVTLQEHVHAEDRAVLLSEFQALATGSKQTLELELRLKSPKHGDIWALARGWAERDEQGRVVRIQGTTIDITRIKRAEAEKRLLESQVLHAQKLESLGVLAGGIAHDFNNLLMSILGNADMALATLSAVSPAREHLEQIQLTSKRAADLTRQMLAYPGKGRFVVEPLKLKDIVEEMVHLLQITISKKAVLKLTFAEDAPAIEADGTQVRQVIMNLITNASEAVGDKSGIISLSTGVQQCDRQYLDLTALGADLPEGDYAFVEVSDTGCGMSREVMDRIFEPFFTTKFTGRGLGMAAVLGIVRGHRGTIKVYSEVGKGTSFKVLFPKVKGSIETKPKTVAVDQNWMGKGIVLLVDDEEMVLRTGRRMLERLGFQVITARDGREALQIFNERHADIVCTVMDLTMPHLNGEEAFREIRLKH